MNINNSIFATEAERIISGYDVIAIRLKPEWRRLLERIHLLGHVQIVIRNRHMWMSRCLVVPHSHFEVASERPASVHSHSLQVVPSSWGSAYVLLREGTFGCSRSLAVFDTAGDAVLELCVTREYWPALDAIVAAFQAEDQSAFTRPVTVLDDSAEPPNDDIDVAGLRAAWDALRPGTSFDALFRVAGVHRTQAYRLAGRQRAEPIDPCSLAPLLKHAAAEIRPVIVRVYSAGGSCAYIGSLTVVDRRNQWLNFRGQCLVAGVNLDGLASAWAVKRCGTDEPTITLEYFNAADRRLLSVALPSTRRPASLGGSESP